MIHLGDITKIDGSKILPVDVIIGGSPCQDLSIAGKREGLSGARSGLFMEQIRIIKEMHKEYGTVYPRFMVWENVPGALSSNQGEDFRVVLEETAKISEPDSAIPRPSKGKWKNSGCIVGDGWSIAWRILDAQFWGVPQRRRRIALVADFGGESAPEILFERKGVSGDFKESGTPWQGVAGAFAEGAGASGCVCLNDQGGSRMDVTEEVAATLRAENHGHPPCVMESAGFCTEHSSQARGIGYEEETSPTLRAGTVPAAVYENHSQDTRYTGPLETAPTVNATYGMGGNNQPFVVETPKTLKIRSGCEGGGKGCGSPVETSAKQRSPPETSAKQRHRPSRQARPLIQDNKSATLGCNNDQTVFVPFVKGTRPHSSDEGQQWKDGTVANTLNTHDVGESRCNELAVKVYGICSKQSHAMQSDNPHSGFYEADTCRCLDANGGNPSCNQGGMAVVAVQDSMIGRPDKNDPQGSGVNEDVSFTLDATDRHAVAYGIDRATYNMGRNAKFGLGIEEELEPTIAAKEPGAVAYCMTTDSYTQVLEEQSPTLMARDYKDPPVVNETEPEYIRRLTPLECERLQGFPDGWTDIGDYTDSNGKKKKSSDTARYKALGNSIALPPWRWVLKRLCNQYDRFATMGSLFDGIGGFPLIWEEINGKGSCLWASEIEEFPIAVTKRRFSK